MSGERQMIKLIQYRKKLKPHNVLVVHGGYWSIWLILGDSVWCWMVLSNFKLFYDLYYLYHLFFLSIFVL